MLARQAVLLTSPESSHSSQLLSRQQSTPVNPLAATLMELHASVANKRLTVWLNPLDATLTKNGGWGGPALRRSDASDAGNLRRGDVQIFKCRSVLSPFLSYFCALFCTSQNLNPFVSNHFRTLCGKPPGVGAPLRALPAPPATLSTNGSPTTRPTFPRRSPLARGDRARHSRFASFHRAASAGRPTLLDRNWFGAW